MYTVVVSSEAGSVGGMLVSFHALEHSSVNELFADEIEKVSNWF